MVTAKLPPFAKIGTKIDVEVSSIGDAKSLQGGTLILTQLRGTDGEVYAVAQGPLALAVFPPAGRRAAALPRTIPPSGSFPTGPLWKRN